MVDKWHSTSSKNVYYARSSIYPKLSESFIDLWTALDSSNVKTNRDKDLLFINTYEESIVAFTIHANLKYLSECEILFAYSTIKNCPKMFYQLFTTHGVKNHNHTLLIFFYQREKQSKCMIMLWLIH